MRRLPLHRLIALMLLVSFTGTGTAAVPALVSLVAAICGGHSVLVSQSAGGAQVVLHHQAGCFTPQAADHTSGLIRGIVRMCEPDLAGDHCLSAARITSGYERAGEEALSLQAREGAQPILAQIVSSLTLTRAATLARCELSKAGEVRERRTGSAAMVPLLI